MKTLLRSLPSVLLSCALLGPAVAQQRSPSDTPPPPRGVEGPEMRKQEPIGQGAPDAPKPEKKGTRARDQKPKDTPPPPRGVEGPEMRKQTPKGPDRMDAPKPEKKGTRARSQKPRHTDTPPKLNTEPEIKQDGGKKTQ